MNSLQNIQNEIFKDKFNSLKGIIKSKAELFNVEQFYHEGYEIIDDSYSYYEYVNENLSKIFLENVKQNSLDNASLFPNEIRIEFQNLVNELFSINDYKNKQFSLGNNLMDEKVEKKLIKASDTFDKLIELIRKDLHLDNTFIHDFISVYQELEKKDSEKAN